MNKNIDNAYLNQYADNVIKRGYEIYDEWIDKQYDSRKIVASANSAVRLFKKRKNMAAFIEALAYLFALDARIKEKYNSILRCLFSYFSWRRETRALSDLKTELNIPLGETDIHNLIALEIEKLAEKLEDGWDEDGDDETHGGKSNGKAEEEVATEEKEAEATEENPEPEELSDKEETEKDSEEKEELPIEEIPQEEAQEEIGETEEAVELQQAEVEATATDKSEEPVQEEHENLKEENSVSDVESEPSTDKKEELIAYNYAVDSPPLYEESTSDRESEKTSFIDEMILDDMVKGDKSVIGYRRIDEAQRRMEADTQQDTGASQNEENKSTEKDAYLYDRTLATDKGNTQQTDKVEATQQTGKVEKEQPKETVQNNVNVNSTEQGFNPLSETPRTDNPSIDVDNNIAGELNANMSIESKMSYIRMKEEMLREHMSITLEELGMNDTPEVLRVSEPEAVSPPSLTYNRK